MEVSPEAIHQRMNKQAVALLQEMIRQALAQVQSLDHLCEDGLFTSFTKFISLIVQALDCQTVSRRPFLMLEAVPPKLEPKSKR